jgi:hypothetical protein
MCALVHPQARIVAMTCTHAALTRRKLVQLGFKFDNLVMEEAAQVRAPVVKSVIGWKRGHLARANLMSLG